MVAQIHTSLFSCAEVMQRNILQPTYIPEKKIPRDKLYKCHARNFQGVLFGIKTIPSRMTYELYVSLILMVLDAFL